MLVAAAGGGGGGGHSRHYPGAGPQHSHRARHSACAGGYLLWPDIFHIILIYYLLQVQSARLAATEATAKANRLSLSYGLGVAIGTALTIKVSLVTRVSSQHVRRITYVTLRRGWTEWTSLASLRRTGSTTLEPRSTGQ